MEEHNTSAPEKKKDIKMMRVAIFAIAAIVIFYLGANFLKGIDVFGKKMYYYAVFDDIGGLTVSSPVQVNGYKIGKITKIKLMNDNPVRICAEIFVNESIAIPKDSKVEVASKDVLGGTIINLLLGESKEIAQNKDTLSAYVVSNGLGALIGKLGNILASVDTIGEGLKNILADGGNDIIRKALTDLESTMAGINDIIADNKLKINRLVTDLTVFSRTLNEASPKLEKLVDNFESIADTVAKSDIASIIINVNKTISDIDVLIKKVTEGDGDIAQLVNNKALYTNLEEATQHLDLLIKDIKENPGRYVTITVFGGKSKQERQEEKAKKKAEKELKKK